MKYRVIISLMIITVAAAFLISAAREDGYGPYRPERLKFVIPKGWPAPTNNIFAENTLTKQGFALGKKLFYDSRLSKDGQVSCASCHQPFAAFTTFDHDLSHGIGSTLTTRNAPSLVNLAWMTSYHWDGGINHIEVQPLSPLTAPNEMGMQLDSVLLLLKEDEDYRRMFKAAFGDAAISSQRMLKALAQFTGNLISADSRYDRAMNGKDTLSNFERSGYQIFKMHCAGCHKEPLFTDNSFRNNGRPLNRFKDIGRMAITGLPADSLKFKVPSLRNVQITHPYMHDGSIYSVPQVVDHYIKVSANPPADIDSLLLKPIVLNRLEKNQLVYFLYTLTDTSFTKNKFFGPDGPVYFKH